MIFTFFKTLHSFTLIANFVATKIAIVKMWSILKLNALLPAIIPWIVFFTVHKQRQDEPFFREHFDREYDYIIGKKNLTLCLI